jgi:hypothetical protein
VRPGVAFAPRSAQPPAKAWISDEHVLDLRAAVNAVLVAAGRPAIGWIDPDLTAVSAKVVHVNQLRTALDEARAALLLPVVQYWHPPLTTGQEIYANDFNDIRGGVQ